MSSGKRGGGRGRRGKAGLGVGGALLAVALYAVVTLLGGDGQPILRELAAGAASSMRTAPSASAPTSGAPASRGDRETREAPARDGGAASIERAFAERRSGFMTTVVGRIEKVLSDDREGSRHQRFIVELPSGRTVLVAHNIDLAPRVPLGRGDEVEIRGQYEWNERGGVLHWTHHDPQGRHDEGFVRHEGSIYQ